MGRSRDHLCPGCGYRASVSGRPDAGMQTLTITVSCRTCRELHDLVTDEKTGGWFRPVPPGLRFCPGDPARSGTHQWQAWLTGGPCPRCGAGMGLDPGGNETRRD